MKRSTFVLVLLAVATAGSVPAELAAGSTVPAPPRSGPEAERFISDLVARMTLEEKIAQMDGSSDATWIV